MKIISFIFLASFSLVFNFNAQAEWSFEHCFVDLWGQHQGAQKILRSFASSDNGEDGDAQKARFIACNRALEYCQVRAREPDIRRYHPLHCRIRPADWTPENSDQYRAWIDGQRNIPYRGEAPDSFPYIDLPLQANEPDGAFPYSNFEGRLDSKHNLELYNRKLESFYFIDGKFHPQKALIALYQLQEAKERWRSSVGGTRYLRAVEQWMMTHEDALEEALERGDYASTPEEQKQNEAKSRVLFAFDMAINSIQDLLTPTKTETAPGAQIPTSFVDVKNPNFWANLESESANTENGITHNRGRRLLRDKIATTLLYMSLVDTDHQEHFFSDTIRLFFNSIRLWHDLAKDGEDEIPHASNLLMRSTPNRTVPLYFMAQSELNDLVENDFDLSNLNPPSSAFWTNNTVEEYDPTSESFYGYDDIFPAEGTVLTYTKMGNGSIKIHANYKNSAGKKRSIKLRIAKESHTTILSARMASAVGYPVIPSVFRSRIKLKLGKKKQMNPDGTVARDENGKAIKRERTYDEFIAEWLDSHGINYGSPHTFIEQSEQDKLDGVVTIKNVCLEGYPNGNDNFRRLGSFRSGRNGFTNRREYRALLIFASLIDLNDTGDTQVRADVYKDQQTGEWKPYFFLSDTGISMGPWFIFDDPGTVNGYRDWISTNAWYNDQVNIWWNHTKYHVDTFESTKYEDAKWLVRRYLRLNENQIENIVRVSGYPEPIVQIYKQKIMLRLHNLAQDFGLADKSYMPEYIKRIERLDRDNFKENNIEQLRNRSWMADTQSLTLATPNTPDSRRYSRQFSAYIDEDGDINERMISWNGTTTALNGGVFWDWDFVLTTVVNVVRAQFQNYISPTEILKQLSLNNFFTYETGPLSVSFLPNFRGSHTISENPEWGNGQKRYLVQSGYTLQIPIGLAAVDTFLDNDLNIQAPFFMEVQWKFNHRHSYATREEAAFAISNESVIPQLAGTARQKMGTPDAIGHILDVEQSFIWGLGTIAGNYDDQIRFNLSLPGYNRTQIKRLRITVPNENLMEVVADSHFDQSIRFGFDVKAYIQLAANKSWTWGEDRYRLYRFDLNNKPLAEKNKMRMAYLDILNHNSFFLADEYRDEEATEGARIDQNYYLSESNFAFLFWSHNHVLDINDINLTHYQNIPGQYVRIPLTQQDMIAGKTEGQIIYTVPEHIEPQKEVVIVAKDVTTDDFSLVGTAAKPADLQGGEKVLDFLVEALDEITFQSIKFEGVANDSLTDFSEVNLAISLNRFHKWVGDQEEFDEEFREFFNSRAQDGGDPNHIGRDIWPGVGALPINAVMYWQLDEVSLAKLMPGLIEQANSVCLLPLVNCSDHQGARDGFVAWTESISNSLTRERKIEKLRNKAQGMVEMIRHFVGSDGENLGKIRNYVSGDERHLLMMTKIQNLPEMKVPVALGQVDYFTRRVGGLPRQFYLRRWRTSHNYLPHLNPGDRDPFDGGGDNTAAQLSSFIDNFDPENLIGNIPGLDGATTAE